MHRSPRYHNWNFVPVWKRMWERYRGETVFVGSPGEHADFCWYVGPVPHYPTKDYLELAQVIAGCDLFVGNQSSPFWVAEALKKQVVLEACLSCQNCHFERNGFTYGVNDSTRLPDLPQQGARLESLSGLCPVQAFTTEEAQEQLRHFAEDGLWVEGAPRRIPALLGALYEEIQFTRPDLLPLLLEAVSLARSAE
jgi:hypothetical protein